MTVESQGNYGSGQPCHCAQEVDGDRSRPHVMGNFALVARPACDEIPPKPTAHWIPRKKERDPLRNGKLVDAGRHGHRGRTSRPGRFADVGIGTAALRCFSFGTRGPVQQPRRARASRRPRRTAPEGGPRRLLPDRPLWLVGGCPDLEEDNDDAGVGAHGEASAERSAGLADVEGAVGHGCAR